MPDKILRLMARKIAAHLGALTGALVPIVVQLLTHQVGWPEAEALSSAVVVTWLLAMAHITGKLAGTIVADLQALAQPGNTGPDLQKLLGDVMGAFTGGNVGGMDLTGMAPPPGMAAAVDAHLDVTQPGGGPVV